MSYVFVKKKKLLNHFKLISKKKNEIPKNLRVSFSNNINEKSYNHKMCGWYVSVYYMVWTYKMIESSDNVFEIITNSTNWINITCKSICRRRSRRPHESIFMYFIWRSGRAWRKWPTLIINIIKRVDYAAGNFNDIYLPIMYHQCVDILLIINFVDNRTNIGNFVNKKKKKTKLKIFICLSGIDWIENIT